MSDMKIQQSETKEIRSEQIDETVTEIKSPEHEKNQLENLMVLRDEDAAQKSSSADEKYPNIKNDVTSDWESSRDVTELAPSEALQQAEDGFNPFFETVEKAHKTEDEQAVEKSRLIDSKKSEDQNESIADESTSDGSAESSRGVTESVASQDLLKVEGEFNPSSTTAQSSIETEESDAATVKGKIQMDTIIDETVNSATYGEVGISEEKSLTESSSQVTGMDDTVTTAIYGEVGFSEDKSFTESSSQVTVMDETVGSAIYGEVGISEDKSFMETSSQVEFASLEIHAALDTCVTNSNASVTCSENKGTEDRGPENAIELPSKQKNVETDDVGEKLPFLQITQASQSLSLEEKIESGKLEKPPETESTEQNLDPIEACEEKGVKDDEAEKKTISSLPDKTQASTDLASEEKYLEKTDQNESLEKVITEEETSDANLNSLPVSTGMVETKLQKDEAKSETNEEDTKIKTDINLANESVMWATEDTRLSKESEQLEKSYGSESIVNIHDAFGPSEASAGIPGEKESLVHSNQIVSVPEASGEESLQKDEFVHKQLVENSGVSQNFEEETDEKKDPDSESRNQILGTIKAIQETNEVAQNIDKQILEIDGSDDGKLGTATVTKVIEETSLQKEEPEGKELKNASELEEIYRDNEKVEDELKERDLGIIDASEKIKTEIPLEEQVRDKNLDTLVATEAQETCFQKEETESDKIKVYENLGYETNTGRDARCRENPLEDDSQNRNFDRVEECSEKNGSMGGTDSENLVRATDAK